MQHSFNGSIQPSYKYCLISNILSFRQIKKELCDPFGIGEEEIMAISPHFKPGAKKTPVKEIRQYLSEEFEGIADDFKFQYLLVANADYYKVITGQVKADADLGYVRPVTWSESIFALYVPSLAQIFHDPEKVRQKIAIAMEAVKAHCGGEYKPPGDEVIKTAYYPKSVQEIAYQLEWLYRMDVPLTMDIEAADLKAHKAGIGTVSFAWNEHEGIAFPVDLVEIPGATQAPFNRMVVNTEVRALLAKFLIRFRQKLIFHNIAYDAYVLIYQLFMDDITDTEGLLYGQEVLLRDWDCTKLVAYLATNTCAGNDLALKSLAQEFLGNWAEADITDITKIPMDKLLVYNLKDSLGTWYVYKKYWPILVADEQEELYNTLFKDSSRDIIEMQLTGLPVNMARVKEVEKELSTLERGYLATIHANYHVQEFMYVLREEWVSDRNAKLVKKRVTLEDVPKTLAFNPNSSKQLQKLLFEQLGLPVLSLTDSKQASTDGDTLEKLLNHTKDGRVLELLQTLVDYAGVNKITSSFLPALLNAVPGKDGWHYLCGNFNLGGTLSGRLSSSDPNLQNIPAGSDYGKLIKSCFMAPEGWLMVGLDFASLEDKISALTTKDPNKLRVYTDGFDGHSLRAYSYWPSQMPDIINTVESINSIAIKYGKIRNRSKAPTFALTYQGTFSTLMKNCGFTEKEAKEIEKRYHELYKVSDAWVKARLKEAEKTGYITAAFGLRIRTPRIQQVLLGNGVTPKEAAAESRSAGNALGQGWCMLNSRAYNAFMKVVRSSIHRTSIRLCAQIHDAGYMLVKDDIKTVLFTNEHLVKEVEWQDHPAIAHDQVKLGGELSIFYPSWAEELTIPNGASESDVVNLIHTHIEKLSK